MNSPEQFIPVKDVETMMARAVFRCVWMNIVFKAKVFAVGKGGIGKSTTSSNLSVAFSKRKTRYPNRL